MDFFEAQAIARRRSHRLVALFFVAVVGTVVALYTVALGIVALTGRDLHGWWHPDLAAGVSVGAILVIGGAAASRWWTLREGGAAVAEMVGGRPVDGASSAPAERMLLNVVEEMAIASGLPVPTVYVLPGEPGINAFAAGLGPADAAVAVSAGALARLNRDELQGVVAHEFSHILHGDMRLNTRLAALVHGLQAVFTLGKVVLRSLGRVGTPSLARRSKKDGGVVVFVAVGLALLIIGWIGHQVGRLIQAAVSRQREYLADAAGAQFTRYPAALADALKKVGGSSAGSVIEEPQIAGFSHHCFAQCFISTLSWFATHPPLEDRIRAIEPGWDGRFIASQIERTAVAVTPEAPRRRVDANALVGGAGQITPRTLAAGAALLARLPDTVRDAAHSSDTAGPLCYALCTPLAATEQAREAAWALVEQHAGQSAAREAARLHAALAGIPQGALLPLAQVAMPTLRALDAADCATVVDTLHVLTHADGRVTPHEFALQKMLARTLGLAARPRSVLAELAPREVVGELSLVLSVAARLEAGEGAEARLAYARAASDFNGLQPPLAYVGAEAGGLARLDVALDRLAQTPPPFRKRVLLAAANAFAADGVVSEAEAELLRAVGAALDCPLPPTVLAQV